MDKYDLLLNDEEFFNLHEEFFGEGSGECCEIDDTDLCFKVAKAQLKKVVKKMSKVGFWNNGQGCYCLPREFYLNLKKIAGVK